MATVEVAGFGFRVSAWCELTAAPGSRSNFARDNNAPFNTLF